MAPILVFCFLLLCLWLWRARRASLLHAWHRHPESGLLLVDVPSFQNLMSREDDNFLQLQLPPRYFRIARRARTRAFQQYLLWIAHDCSILQLVAASARVRIEECPSALRSMTAMSFRLRFVALGLWMALWMQWAFPRFDLTPASLIAAYEELVAGIGGYLTRVSGAETAARAQW